MRNGRAGLPAGPDAHPSTVGVPPNPVKTDPDQDRAARIANLAALLERERRDRGLRTWSEVRHHDDRGDAHHDLDRRIEALEALVAQLTGRLDDLAAGGAA